MLHWPQEWRAPEAHFCCILFKEILRYSPPMPLRLYNSLSKGEEDFESLEKGKVRMYTCGPTVYGRPHIGNYSSFLMADLLRRWLEVSGYSVTHVKNITDVGHLVADADEGEDKLEKQAKEEKSDPLAIAKKYTEQYLEDEKVLNLLEPAHRPRATEFVSQMITIIESLIASGHAYETDDGVYFSVETFPEYGKLSGNTLENIEAGARIEVDEKKKHPADFALWKKTVGSNAHHILKWPSPWGEGFPGWHIECSAMSRALLGEQIDIHTGGEDNIFPHHECEIAQSECSGEHPFSRFWLHKRRIEIAPESDTEEGVKMSKSLGNILTVSDIVNRGYDALDLRYFLLSAHYRTRLKFSWKSMDDAKKARKKILEWMSEVESWNASSAPDSDTDSWKKKFQDAMNDDLNTSAALAVIFDAMSWSRNVSGWSSSSLASLKEFIEIIRHTFGCFDSQKEEAVPSDVQELVKQRAEARAQKNFSLSDELRDKILEKGFEVKDTSEGQRVTKR
jgi:cysteinyl-tRNA synthetase